MRARLLGAVLAAFAAPASGLAQPAPAGGVACGSGALLLCTALAPGFTRWIFTPLGIAPPDAEMAAEICPASKGLKVALSRRRPVESGPLTRIVVLDVACAPLAAAVRPATGPGARPVPSERPVLAGSPQDFTPQIERGDRADAEMRRAARAERRARRENARERRREAQAAIEARELRRARAADGAKRRTSASDAPPAAPRPAERPSPPRAVSAPVEPKPASPSPAPATESKPVTSPSKPSRTKRTPKDDPSISYEHF